MGFSTGKRFNQYSLSFIQKGDGIYELVFNRERNIKIEEENIFNALLQSGELIHTLIRRGIIQTIIIRLFPVTNSAFKNRIVKSLDDCLIGFTYDKKTEKINGATVHTYSKLKEEVKAWQLGEI
ncbi:MAG: hypothetical protein ACRCSG_00110 [Cellulosilyticaceae bacterium]